MRHEEAEGKIVRIELDEQSCCFAKLLVFPLVSFFDNLVSVQSTTMPSDLGVMLFKVWVSKEGWIGKRWKFVGKENLSAMERVSPKFFKKDKVDGKYYEYSDARFSLSTLQACVGLERAAVWDPVHVEDRLLAYYRGEKSIFEESMKA